MSLEATIAENTAAIRDLIAAIAASNSLTAAIEPTPGFKVEPVDLGQVEAKPARKAKTQPVEEPEIEPAESMDLRPYLEEPAPTVSEVLALDYDADVKPVIIKASTAGKRDTVVSLLAKYGAAKGPELKPEHYGAFVAALSQEMAA
jgi:hypothetical protein